MRMNNLRLPPAGGSHLTHVVVREGSQTPRNTLSFSSRESAASWTASWVGSRVGGCEWRGMRGLWRVWGVFSFFTGHSPMQTLRIHWAVCVLMCAFSVCVLYLDKNVPQETEDWHSPWPGKSGPWTYCRETLARVQRGSKRLTGALHGQPNTRYSLTFVDGRTHLEIDVHSGYSKALFM